MPNLHHLYNYYRQYGLQHKPLYAASIMLFFFTIFDGVLEFITPIVITQHGVSEGVMGLIIGFSSFSGMVFDLIICRVLKDTNYRRLYLIMLILCSIYPLLLWQSNTVWLYLITMAIWGLYYDLYNLGNFDFIARTSKPEEHATSFGVMQVFIGLGYLLAPIVIGLLITERVEAKPFVLAWIFLGLSFLAYLCLIYVNKQQHNNSYSDDTCPIKRSLFTEVRLWKKISKFILPVLLVTLMLNVVDSFFWTIGPLLSEKLGTWGSLFMTAYLVPPLLVGWFVGNVSSRFGQKRTAIYAIFGGSAVLTLFFIFEVPILYVLGSLFAAFFISFAWPTINGAYADYIAETPKAGKEIETLQDSFANFGFIIGPVLAGFSGQYLGHAATFTVLGIIGIMLSIYLLTITPRSITIKLPKK